MDNIRGAVVTARAYNAWMVLALRILGTAFAQSVKIVCLTILFVCLFVWQSVKICLTFAQSNDWPLTFLFYGVGMASPHLTSAHAYLGFTQWETLLPWDWADATPAQRIRTAFHPWRMTEFAMLAPTVQWAPIWVAHIACVQGATIGLQMCAWPVALGVIA